MVKRYKIGRRFHAADATDGVEQVGLWRYQFPDKVPAESRLPARPQRADTDAVEEFDLVAIAVDMYGSRAGLPNCWTPEPFLG